MKFLIVDVASKADYFHSVAQGKRNGVEDIGRANKHNLREVKRHFKIMVRKLFILLRVENLQKCRGRVPSVIRSKFVNFIKHKHRIFGASISDALNDSARHCPDISSPVAPKFGLVSDAPQRNSHKFTIKSFCD